MKSDDKAFPDDDAHPDDDALNAHFDGDDTDWTAHLAACGPCSERLGRLALVRDALAAPIGAPLEARERAIAAALATYDEIHDGTGPRVEATATSSATGLAAAHRLGDERPSLAPVAPIRRARRPAFVAVASVAAVLLAVVGAAGVLTRGGGAGSANQALAGRDAAEERSTSAAGGDPAGGISDLGDIVDADALVAKVTGTRRPLAESSTGESSSVTGSASAEASATNSGATGDAVASAGSSLSAPPVLGAPGAIEDSSSSPANSGARSDASASPGPGAVAGPQAPIACEQGIRDSRPNAGDIVYRAEARYQGRDALVLGLRPPPVTSAEGTEPLTLVLVARDDCQVLLEVVVP